MEGRASGAVKRLAPGPRVMLAADLYSEDLGLVLLLVPFWVSNPSKTFRRRRKESCFWLCDGGL